MKYLIMVSHGRFAEGVKTSLEMFAGDALVIAGLDARNDNYFAGG